MSVLAFAGFGWVAYEDTTRRRIQHIENADALGHPELLFLKHMPALAFAGFGWVAYEHSPHQRR